MSGNRTKEYYEAGYRKHGCLFQRLYPNEELLRFLGRNYFCCTQPSERETIRVLELGCGTCANTWMLAREGFAVSGVDFSPAALHSAREVLKRWGVHAELYEASMDDLPFENSSFDVVLDIFSMSSLDYDGHLRTLDEVQRVTKPDGRFFSYHPAVDSDAYTNHAPATKVDEFTLASIERVDSPHYGHKGQFCFLSREVYQKLLSERGFEIDYVEKVTKTYNEMSENFTFLTISARKVNP